MTRRRWKEDDFTVAQRDWRIWGRLLRRVTLQKKSLVVMGVLSLVMPGLHVTFPLLTRQLIDVLLSDDTDGWVFWASLQGVLRMCFGITVFLFIRTCGGVATQFAKQTREICFTKLQSLSFSYFDSHNTGWLMARLTTDCDRLARLISFRLFDIFWGTFYLVFIIVAMFWVDWQLALVVMTVVPPLALASWFFQSRILHANREARRINSQITASFSEAIAGVKTTKTLVREEENLGDFREETSEMFTQGLRVAKLHSMYIPIVMSLGAIGGALALWAGGIKLQRLADPLYIGTVVAFIMFARQFFQPIQDLAQIFCDLQAAQAAAERVETLLDTPSDIEDSPEVLARIANQERLAAPGLAADGMNPNIRQVAFENVNFSYDENQKVLSNFNLTIQPGQTVALVGPTGGGKTTIVSLLCRFYEPTDGRIVVDGVDYRDRGLLWWQGQFGIVLQEPQLFSGTIRENIRFGRLDATDEEVEQAARVVCADAFILEMDEGYDTPLAQAGEGLSTGQKQLISFARAILADPQIFVMDEATSSIDAATEKSIQQGLSEILKNRISFVIAHRLSTIRSADVILFVKDGSIVEQGTHHELLLAGGAYYDLYTNQFTQEQTDRIMRSLHDSEQ